MLTLDVDGERRVVTFRKFPAGESLVRIEGAHELDLVPSGEKKTALISMRFEGNEDLINLAMLVDAVRRHFDLRHLGLDMPYLPYARQDRVCSRGESLSVKVAADLINSLKFDRVWCTDIHSDVGAALIDNLVHTSQGLAAERLKDLHPDAILIAPDAGAIKKVEAFARGYGYREVIQATKRRDLGTGAITGTAVHCGHLGDVDLLIMDDICDGGRTFIELAKVLRPLTTGRLFLYVTHGIFSQGCDELEKHFDRIYTANLMGHPHPLVETI